MQRGLLRFFGEAVGQDEFTHVIHPSQEAEYVSGKDHIQIGIKLGENDNFPIHRENLVRTLSAMVSAATALAGSA